MVRKFFALLSVGMIALASTNANAAYSTAVSNFTEAQANPGPQQSLGFDFKANSVLVVNELGAFQATATSGINPAGQVVYLEDLTTSTVIATATVVPAYTPNNFNYALLNGGGTVQLNTTDTYSIYTNYLANSQQYGLASSLGYSSDLTIVPIGGDNSGYTQGSTPVPPTIGFNNILSVDFQYIPLSQLVPEPASVSMLGLGLAGIAFMGRKVARRRA
jgi:hypothetical protein